MIVIVDYGMGNLGSVKKMFARLGAKDVTVSSDSLKIRKAQKLIFPGVGNFAAGMKNLKKYKIQEALEKKVLKEKTPVLGLCLGMQLLSEWGQEGNCAGLGWIKGEVIRFDFDRKNSLKVPHMGWNSVDVVKKSPLTENILSSDRFYFAHSYHLVCQDKKDILAKTFYGYDFVSIIQKENIFGVQFHPEKSYRAGAKLLENFLNIQNV